MTEPQKQIQPAFDTIREQRGMHCMWTDISDMKEKEIEEKWSDNTRLNINEEKVESTDISLIINRDKI